MVSVLKASRLSRFGSSSVIQKPRVAVGMSGGIDSAAAAYILQSSGYDVIGVFMENWDSSDEAGESACSYSQDLKDVRAVCSRLNIPLHTVSFITEYWNEVFQPTLDIYESGNRTPNPDVACNKVIKFGLLKDYVKKNLGVDYLATGHYARLAYDSKDGGLDIPNFGPEIQDHSADYSAHFDHHRSPPRLLRGCDGSKDQSYFLSMTSSEQLRGVIFPLGQFYKKDIRSMVSVPLRGLSVLTKPESMGVCFIGKRKFSSFLENYITMTPGRYIDVDSGKVIGSHRGREALTVGQRARIGGAKGRYFVVAETFAVMQGHESKPGDIFVAFGSDHPALFSRSLRVENGHFSWVHSAGAHHERLGTGGLDLLCKARYGQEPERCTVKVNQSGDVEVEFYKDQRCITPGQVCVLYDGDICLGGGLIAG